MLRSWSTVLLILFLLGPASLSHAAKPKHPPPVATPAPSPAQTLEAWCARFGVLVAAIVVDRDALVPLSTTAARLRIIVSRDLAALPADQRQTSTERMVQLAYDLYAMPGLSAAQARHAFEIGCLNPEATVPVEQPAKLWR